MREPEIADGDYCSGSLLMEHTLEKTITEYVKQDRTGEEARQRGVLKASLASY